MFQLTIAQGYSIATMLLVAGAALLATAVFYRRIFRALEPSRQRLLLLLRFVAVVLVVLLLFRPVLSYQRDVLQPRAIIFLVDSSASMSIADDPTGVTRFEQARGRVADWWGKLAKEFDLHLIEFSDRANSLRQPSDLAQVKPVGEATSLTRALAAAGQKAPRREVEAVVLLSDGVHNAAGDPVAAARKLGVMVHTVGVGNSLRDSPSYRDIQVTALECPEQLPLKNKVKITAYVDAIGYAGLLVKVTLEEDGKPVDEKELVLDGAGGAEEVVFQFTPTVKGRHTYTARVPLAPGEKIEQNNHRSVSALVVDIRMRVLYVEGTLRAEFGALVDRLLSKDPDIDFCALVQTRPNVFVQRTNIQGLKLTGIPSDPAVLEKFDVFLLGDLDSTYLKPAQMVLLQKRVREGAGLVMLGGYHSLGPGGYAGTPLEEVLPVLVGSRDVGQVTDSFLPALTPEGRNHPIFSNIAKFFPSPGSEPLVAGLPALEGCTRVAGPKPGASILAVYPAAGQAPLPVLAVHPFGKGRVAAFTGDTTRAWQQAPRALGQETPFLRFWGQTVRWLANRSDSIEQGISARTDKGYYEPDAPVAVLAVVRDKDGEGAAKAVVTARVKGPRGVDEGLTLAADANSAGNFKALFEPRWPGTYEIAVAADLNGGKLSAPKLSVEVGRPNLEFDRLDLDDKLLKRIAAETGGQYHHVTTADRLIEQLNRTEQRRRVYLEQPLYFPLLYWALFVGVLTTEWVLRKRYQLR